MRALTSVFAVSATSLAFSQRSRPTSQSRWASLTLFSHCFPPRLCSPLSRPPLSPPSSARSSGCCSCATGRSAPTRCAAARWSSDLPSTTRYTLPARTAMRPSPRAKRASFSPLRIWRLPLPPRACAHGHGHRLPLRRVRAPVLPAALRRLWPDEGVEAIEARVAPDGAERVSRMLRLGMPIKARSHNYLGESFTWKWAKSPSGSLELTPLGSGA